MRTLRIPADASDEVAHAISETAIYAAHCPARSFAPPTSKPSRN